MAYFVRAPLWNCTDPGQISYVSNSGMNGLCVKIFSAVPWQIHICFTSFSVQSKAIITSQIQLEKLVQNDR